MFLEHFFSDDLGHVEIMPFHDGNSETFKKHLPPWMTKICVYYYYKSWAEDDNAILRDLATESEVKLASFDTFRRTWKEDFPDVTTPKTKGGKKPVDTSWEKCLTLPWKLLEAVPLSYAKAIHDASGSREVFNEDGTMVKKKWYAGEYYHAACCGAFIAGLAVELRKLLAVACVTDGVMHAFGQRLEAVVHIMEAVDYGHRFRLAYLRKLSDTHMHNGDTFALEDVQERYPRSGTENTGSPEFTELLELNKDRVHHANIASVPLLSRLSHDGDGNRDSFKNARPARETTASRTIFAKDVTKDYGKGNMAKAEAPTDDKAE
eukprot:jgi/Tetstr1/421145/TSEL_012188.t1